MNKKIIYWIEMSDYDLETAFALFKSKRYLYVGFMAHQSIEKILKAYFVKQKQGETPPYSHSLSFLAKKANIYGQLSENQKDLLDILEPLNIEARYPSDKERLLKSLTETRCRDILSQTEELQKWIKRKFLQN